MNSAVQFRCRHLCKYSNTILKTSDAKLFLLFSEKKKNCITRKIVLRLADKKSVKIIIIFALIFSNPVSFLFVSFAVQQMRNSAGTTKVLFPLKRCLYILFCCSIVCFPPPMHIADCTHYSVSGHCERHPSSAAHLQHSRAKVCKQCKNLGGGGGGD